MDVTLTRRQLAYGVGAVALLLVARQCGRPEEVVETVTAENPLVIESPRLRVVSGADTLVARGPALFVFVGLDTESGVPSERILESIRGLQSAVADAEPGLEAMGVRVFLVDRPPVPLGVSPEADAAAGPPLAPGGMGLLLADPQGRIQRLGRDTGAAALVCAAARTFGREAPSPYAASCR